LIFSHKTLPASFAVNCMECIAVNEVELLQHELTEMRNSYFKACTLVAEMHAEAVGGPVGNGPKRGVVEDVEDLRNERDALKKENGELRAQLEALRQGGHDDGVQHSIEPPQADAR
jgi:FtsZ-binding cell division protein ZapB